MDEGEGSRGVQALPIPSPLTLSYNATPSNPECSRINRHYQIAPSVICGMCFVFGIIYSFFGYRFFKATMFLTGFIFGAVLTYLICLEEDLLPLEGKIGVALAAGVLCGLITMLVQYVGLFMTGLVLGILLGISSLVVMEQFYHPENKWIPIGILFGGGLLLGLLSLYFQKGLTILGTSLFGAALMITAIDYFSEKFMMIFYVWERTKAEPAKPICWFSWLILGLWPLTCLFGILTQWRLTGKDFDHQEADTKQPTRSREKPNLATPVEVVHSRKQQKLNLERMRAKEKQDAQQSRYRHLYQIRRSNGDVICRSYIQNIHTKLSPALRSLAQIQQIERDSTQTTLTQVP